MLDETPVQINWLTAGGPGEEKKGVVAVGPGIHARESPARDVRVSLCYHFCPSAA